MDGGEKYWAAWAAVGRGLFNTMMAPFRKLFGGLARQGVMGQIGKAVGERLIGAAGKRLKSMVEFAGERDHPRAHPCCTGWLRAAWA